MTKRTISIPRYERGCGLGNHNHMFIWPFCDLRPRRDDKRTKLFELEDGWLVVGWCDAPFKSARGYNDALVLEFWGDEDECENGLWWIHCRIKEMNFTNLRLATANNES